MRKIEVDLRELIDIYLGLVNGMSVHESDLLILLKGVTLNDVEEFCNWFLSAEAKRQSYSQEDYDDARFTLIEKFNLQSSAKVIK